MPKKQNRYFWLPLRFDVLHTDTPRLTPAKCWLYINTLKVYWQSGCNFPYADLGTALHCKDSDIDDLFNRVPSLEVIEGMVHHQVYFDEYARALRKSEGASKAAAVRWKGVNND
jgi:hypothetical protein